jgi:hypothetical protein
MGEALVGAMVAALRRANRDWAEASRAQRKAAPRSEGAAAPAHSAAECARRAERRVAGTDSAGAAWGYLVHPALMPTVYSPSEDACGDTVVPVGWAAPCERRAERHAEGTASSGALGEEVAARKV